MGEGEGEGGGTEGGKEGGKGEGERRKVRERYRGQQPGETRLEGCMLPDGAVMDAHMPICEAQLYRSSTCVPYASCLNMPFMLI